MDQMITTIGSWMIDNLPITIVGAITLIQITPLKLDPWGRIAKTIKSYLNGDIEKELNDLKVEVMDNKVSSTRWQILDFANSSRQGRKHTKEEWDHCMTQLAWYEGYCEKENIPNGVMQECSGYLRELYRKSLRDNSFLI